MDFGADLRAIMNSMNKTIFLSILFLLGEVAAHAGAPVLADTSLLKELKINPLYVREDIHVGLAVLSDKEQERLSQLAHAKGRCGGYQVVPELQGEGGAPLKSFSTEKLESVFKKFDRSIQAEKRYVAKKYLRTAGKSLVSFDPQIRDALKEVNEARIGEWIQWLSDFGGRFHGAQDPNRHTQALVTRLKQMTASLGYPVSVDLVSHQRTQQKSVRLRIEGSKRPNEVVVLGGHLDSINSSFFGDRNQAPGADDNASGSSALIESLQVLIRQGQPERTVEYFWYAAEEVGLFGSTEIATQYRRENKDVVAVLQLDMTLHPGSGESTISSISDFTSGWLRDILVELNRHYLQVKIIDDKCGYACSDHASWYREGYPTLMPFESSTPTMNRKIHTVEDKLGPSSSLKHAAIFSKIAVAYAMTLANSDMRQP